MTPVLITAHQGGWDEVLLVAVPVALFALLLRTANKRAGRLAEQAAALAADRDAHDAADAVPEEPTTGD